MSRNNVSYDNIRRRTLDILQRDGAGYYSDSIEATTGLPGYFDETAAARQYLGGVIELLNLHKTLSDDEIVDFFERFEALATPPDEPFERPNYDRLINDLLDLHEQSFGEAYEFDPASPDREGFPPEHVAALVVIAASVGAFAVYFLMTIRRR